MLLDTQLKLFSWTFSARSLFLIFLSNFLIKQFHVRLSVVTYILSYHQLASNYAVAHLMAVHEHTSLGKNLTA